jgi:hypothetical protein
MTTKRCPRCAETKPLDEFHRDRTSPDGVQSRCKACVLAAQRLARAKKKPGALHFTPRELGLWRALVLACAQDHDYEGAHRWLVSTAVTDPDGAEGWFAAIRPSEREEAEDAAGRLVQWALRSAA